MHNTTRRIVEARYDERAERDKVHKGADMVFKKIFEEGHIYEYRFFSVTYKGHPLRFVFDSATGEFLTPREKLSYGF